MNAAELPSTSKRLNPNDNDQKKIQEKAKRELDAIIQSWKDNSEGIVCETEENGHSFKALHAGYPSGTEEIEGSDCSNLQHLDENNTKESGSSLTGGQRVATFSMASEVQNEELQLAAELCQKAGDLLKTSENQLSMCVEDGKNLPAKAKNSKVTEMSGSTVNEVAISSSGEKLVSSTDKSDNNIVCQSVNQHNDITVSSNNKNQKKHLCNLCGKHYRSLSHLTRHIKTTHDKQKTHLCNICNTSFTRSESLVRHLRMHEQHDGTEKTSKQGPFKCPKCHKSYQQAYNVTRHMLSHNGVKPFKCTECNKSFTQYTGLSRHLVLHKGSRDFKCKECGKSFARLFVLNRHLLTHSNDKPYKCFVCSKSFIRASQLSNHMNSHQKKS